MTLNDSGNVGIGTTPGEKLHVADLVSTVGNPTIRLEGNTGGYGAGVEAGAALTSGSYLAMGKVVWDGEGPWNTTVSTQDSFFTIHTAQDGVLGERLHVTSAGSVGIGDTTPDFGLDVVADVNSDDCFREAGTQVAGTCASDIRLKENIRTLSGSLDKVLALRPVEFEWKKGIEELGGTIRYVEGQQVGLIAQEVQTILPDWIREKNGYLSVRYNLELPLMLVNAIQELNIKLENQEKEIQYLKNQLNK